MSLSHTHRRHNSRAQAKARDRDIALAQPKTPLIESSNTHALTNPPVNFTQHCSKPLSIPRKGPKTSPPNKKGPGLSPRTSPPAGKQFKKQGGKKSKKAVKLVKKEGNLSKAHEDSEPSLSYMQLQKRENENEKNDSLESEEREDSPSKMLDLSDLAGYIETHSPTLGFDITQDTDILNSPSNDETKVKNVETNNLDNSNNHKSSRGNHLIFDKVIEEEQDEEENSPNSPENFAKDMYNHVVLPKKLRSPMLLSKEFTNNPSNPSNLSTPSSGEIPDLASALKTPTLLSASNTPVSSNNPNHPGSSTDPIFNPKPEVFTFAFPGQKGFIISLLGTLVNLI